MSVSNPADRFPYFNHLGFHNPYWTLKGGKINIFEKAHEITKVIQPKFDFTGFTEMINLGYCLDNRTLIQGLHRTPWMAKPDPQFEKWEYYMVPPHGEKREEPAIIACTLFNLLKEELRQYVSNHKNIGILLTGGMDSRIIACVLKDLIASAEIDEKNVIAFTWGATNSRDVVYAQKLAKLLGWTWEHISVDVAQMQTNIDICIANGCEFSPLHLHGMSQLVARKDVDCYLAASYGDSIGRGEYSGTKVLALDYLGKSIRNPMSVLRNDFKELIRDDLEHDLNTYWTLFPRSKEYQNHELDRQGHYMRRMLNSCMSIINEKIPLYQLFSAPSVYGYMWSMAPQVRNDLVYKVILEKYNRQLLEIPWARTGLKYTETDGVKDQFMKNHHEYSKMIRKHFFPYIRDTIHANSEVVGKLCNTSAVIQLFNNCVKYPIEGQYRNEERLLYLACVTEFIVRHNIDISHLPQYSSNRLVAQFKADMEYKVRYIYRRVRY